MSDNKMLDDLKFDLKVIEESLKHYAKRFENARGSQILAHTGLAALDRTCSNLSNRALLMEWQPIENAPKDGTFILAHDLAYKFPIVINYFKCDDWQGWIYSDESFVDDLPEPTHWMPLPTPPEKTNDR